MDQIHPSTRVVSPYVPLSSSSHLALTLTLDWQAWKEDKECAKFLNDPAVQNKLATAKKLSEVSVSDYDAIFYVGGHGPVIDLASDPVNAKLASGVSRF